MKLRRNIVLAPVWYRLVWNDRVPSAKSFWARHAGRASDTGASNSGKAMSKPSAASFQMFRAVCGRAPGHSLAFCLTAPTTGAQVCSSRVTRRLSTQTLLTIAIGATLVTIGAASAQDATPAADPSTDEPAFTADELDVLAAPVALYPDSLLAQVFVAATFPLEVMKADRLVDERAELSSEGRADAVEAEDWDPSVQVLTAGFPTVIGRMADEIDWTEQLGEAVLVQTDDLLDAVQRKRAQAAATGYLATNEAQVVEVEDDAISIAPADPHIVYVPSYDPALAFTSAPTAGPVFATDPGLTTTDLVTTGAIAFGGAFLVNELFDDDDDWGDDYWRGPPRIDWDVGDFRPRPDINVDGDVNINRGRFTNIDRDRVNIDRDRIGSLDRDRLDAPRARGWEPSNERQKAARDKIASRKPDSSGRARDALRAGGNGDARAKLEKATTAKRPPAGARRPDSALKPHAASAPKLTKTKERAQTSGKKPQVQRVAASRAKPAAQLNKVSRPQAAKKPTAKRAPQKISAFKKSGGGRPKAAAARGKASEAKRRR